MIRSVPMSLPWSGSVFGEYFPLCSKHHIPELTDQSYFTVLRLALPRTSIRDITYEGVVIPKGTVFFLNAWACNMGKSPHLNTKYTHSPSNNLQLTHPQTQTYGPTPKSSDQSAGSNNPTHHSSPTVWDTACAPARSWQTVNYTWSSCARSIASASSRMMIRIGIPCEVTRTRRVW